MERGGIGSARGYAAIVAVVLLLASCTALPTPTPTPTPTSTPTGDGVLRVGTLLSASDPAAAAAVAGVNAAVREINAAGGVNSEPVEVVTRNAGDTADTAAAALADLVARGVDVVVGPSSDDLVASVTDAAAASDVPVLPSAGSAPLDPVLAAAILREDPGVSDPTLGAIAYEDVVRAALAAAIASDDGGASLTRELPAVSSGEVACGGYGSCLDAVTQGFSIAYAGVSLASLSTDSASPDPSATP